MTDDGEQNGAGSKLRVNRGKGDKYRETWLPGDLAESIRIYADMADLAGDDPYSSTPLGKPYSGGFAP